MPSPADSTPVPTIPLVRECRPGGLRPLLAPGGREPFFSPDIQRLMLPPDEGLARFLPPAKWVMPDRQERAQEGKASQVTYTIPDEIIKTARPLTTLPRSEIDAFSAAIQAFVAKSRPDAKNVSPYMRQCRQEFRLPNPEFDPEAYWVYGPEYDRRLLILWGCEPQAGMSLTLEQAEEKMRAREMSWRDKQDMALALALQPTEPLSRFLAKRAANGDLQVGNSIIAAKKLSRLKTISPSECHAFESAAKAYYAKAHAGSTAAPFELELRAGLRLPSLVQVPGDYYRIGSRLVIALDTWPKDACIPAVEDTELKLPEGPAAASSIAAPVASTGETVASQLRARQEPAWVRYAKLAAAVAILALAGGAAWLFRPDHTPPEFRSIETTDRNTIVVAFNEELDPASIEPKVVAGQAPADPLTFSESKLEIKDRSLRSPDRRAIIIHTKTDMKHGEPYELGIRLVADKKHNAIETLSKPVTYYDKAAPKLLEVSAGATKRMLVLVFSKDMSDDFRKARFELSPVDGSQRGRRIPVTPTLDPEQKKLIQLEASDDFVENKPYVIDVSGVNDSLDPQPNPVAEDGATNRKFDYVNRLPPSLRGGAIANGGEYKIKLQFSGRLDATKAKDAANYVITAPDNSKLRIKAGGVSLDETETLVTLELEPARLNAAKHKLQISNLATKQGVALKAPLEVLFEFNDSTNRTPLAVSKVERNGPRLTLSFDRAVSQETAFATSHYRLLDSERRPTGINVTKAEGISGQTSKAVVELARTPGAGKYLLEVTGLIDVFGNPQDTPALGGFDVSGISIKASSLIDWAQPPVLRSGGVLLVISVSDKVTQASAENVANYTIEPAAIKVQKLESFKTGTDDNPVTTITLRLTAAPTGPVSVAVQGLILQSHPTRGPQSLPMRPAQLAP